MTYFFQKGHPSAISYPVMSLSALTPGSKLHSPKVGNPHGLPAPNHPGSLAFEDELAEVLLVRSQVIQHKLPYEFFAKHFPGTGYDPRKVPEVFRANGLDYGAAALVRHVHKDNPIDIGLYCWKYLVSTGATLRHPDTGHNDFLNRVPDAHLALATRVCDALHKCFEVKYYYGKTRPEEAAARAGLPVALKDVTGYPEGCPNHPAYPAGHAAAAGAVSVLFELFNTTPEQRKHVVIACYVWAQSRTLAGVHYAYDNLAGLALGGMGTFDGENWAFSI